MQTALNSPLQINADDFTYFQEVIRLLAGITLSNSKHELVQSRLRSRVTALSFGSFSEYRALLESLAPSDPEWQVLINLLTTNKTDWFREPQHFEMLIKSFLPAWLKLNKRHLQVWCAASSTGEEPYTLALLLNSAFQGTNVTFEITATDIDTNVLQTAKSGVYSKDRLIQIPERFHKEGFDFGRDEISAWVRVKKHLKEKIHFETFNLSEPRFPWKEKYDIIFCRNVLIYFSPEMTQAVVENAFQTAAKNAVLVIAHSESLQNLKTSWAYVQPSVYRKGGKLVW